MPPGNPNGYGPNGVVWSSDPYTPHISPFDKAVNMTMAGGLVGGALYGAHKLKVGQGTGLDMIQRAVRYATNVIPPASLLNTFRSAEHLSPFVSGAAYVNKSKFMKVAGDSFTYTWSADILKGKDTAQWLRAVVGADHPSMVSATLDSGSELVFKGQRGKLAGSLFLKSADGKETLLSKAIALAEASSVERGVEFAPKKANTYIQSISQSLITETGEALSERKGFKLDKAFATIVEDPVTKIKSVERAMLFPVPSIAGPIDNASDLARRTTLLRAPFAFGMERLNRLIQVTAEQIPLIGHVDDALNKHFNASLGVKSGPASKMFARFGLKAGAIAGGAMLIQQGDWLRRQGGFGGEVIASGAVSIASTALLSKIGFTGKTALAAGIVSFFGQLSLPNFDKGLWTGAISTLSGLDVARSAVSEVLLLNSYRRVLEGFLPGVSSKEFGVLAGLGAVGIAYSGLPQQLMKHFDVNSMLPTKIRDVIGFDPSIDPRLAADQLPKSTRKYYMERAMDIAEVRFPGIHTEKDTFIGRRKTHAKMMQKAAATYSPDEFAKFQDELTQAWESAEHLRKEAIKNNPLDASLAKRHAQIGYGGTVMERLTKTAKRSGASLFHAFFGATFEGEAYKNHLTNLSVKKRLGRIATIFGAAFAAQQVLTGGIGTMESPFELSGQYFGDDLVPVRRAQFWEAGGAPFRGEEVMYYRPSYLKMLKSRTRDIAEWGEDEDTISPIGKFLRKNFTYELERRNYYDRPYPISGTAFEDVPVIGRMLAATIGQVIKPAKLMHVPEWARMGADGRMQFAVAPEYNGPAYNLGGLGPGTPISPYAASTTVGYMSYQFRELEGMTGWLKNLIQKSVTGSEFNFVGRPELASASLMGSLREQFWELNLGGGLFTTEAIRRFLPRERGERQEYNPILNNMPSWMPSRFHRGDPYRKVELGYARMPGSGYEALHPELQGLTPENYPLIYRYEILGDVAPSSQEFRQTRQRLYQARASGQTTPEINAYMDRIDAQVSAKRIQDFSPVDPNAIQLPGSGLTQRAWAGMQTAVRKTAAPAEYMIPMGFRPFQKLMSDRDAIEQYEYERLYGSKVAFWDEPIRDWFRPAFHSAANLLGWDGKPGWRKDADAINEYYDKLEFFKQMQLAERAEIMGDRGLAHSHRYQASKTRFGVNPMGDPMGIYMSLPDSEKKFFDAFSYAQGKDRQRIMEMVPEDQIHLYKAIWGRLDSGEQPFAGSVTQQGDMYLNSRMADVQEYFYDKPMPGTDWIGWHEDAEMDDIKLRHIQSLGKDIHEYDMWHKQVRMLARKPYLQGAESFMAGDPVPGRGMLLGHIYDMVKDPNGPTPLELSAYQNGTSLGSSARFYYNDDRSGYLRQRLNSYQEY